MSAEHISGFNSGRTECQRCPLLSGREESEGASGRFDTDVRIDAAEVCAGARNRGIPKWSRSARRGQRRSPEV